ncbi:DUF6194 family protein [Streptomyces triticirhizae]|uniref:DUF6194 domain-containing protein n=1 Tax=Streptomyces triticirhizae TaxID=2483353 RepID=A0A3M2LDN8_9ACTN|nr:DUF6194 family protein [Streptomyces triticirhizae]RMI34723.1 hypothetical protein EBN88_23185 [Streptomyces triticirhizae]
MTMDEIIDWVSGLDGVLTLRPAPGDGTPETSWGDTFFYYAPDGAVPATGQPFATIVTRDQPGDGASRLDRPDTFRVNMAAGREAFVRWTGRAPREAASVEVDHGVTDAVIPHPVYGAAGWLAVVNPGERAGAATRELLRTAHRLARARHERRTASGTP